jgi:ribosomal protein S19
LAPSFNIYDRAGTITPDLINSQVKIHNGLTFSKPLTISPHHIGLKFGSLVLTKKFSPSKLSSRPNSR